MTDRTAAFWSEYQPGFRQSSAAPGSSAFFRDVDSARYELEPHIPAIADFERWAGKAVLDVGCGIATDGARFARAGAAYTGFDRSETAIELARTRFELQNLEGEFVLGDATRMPLRDDSFDLVWSNGVLHHIDDIDGAVAEIRRVLKPGGTAILMVYHRDSLNYVFTIMTLRRLLTGLLLVPGMTRLVAATTGERREVLEGHRNLFRKHGLGYLTDKGLFLSNNTDGPGNQLSRVYRFDEFRALLERHGFTTFTRKVRYLNLRSYPGGARFSRTHLAQRLAERAGWHLYVEAR